MTPCGEVITMVRVILRSNTKVKVISWSNTPAITIQRGGEGCGREGIGEREGGGVRGERGEEKGGNRRERGEVEWGEG